MNIMAKKRSYFLRGMLNSTNSTMFVLFMNRVKTQAMKLDSSQSLPKYYNHDAHAYILVQVLEVSSSSTKPSFLG